jgi:hypothetical protein
MPPPSQLVELEFSSVLLDYSTFSTGLPCCLPNLTKLQMREVGLRAPLLHYFEFPRLKTLLLDMALVTQSSFRTLVPPIVDDLFFRSIPELELLSIRYMKSMDEALTTSLHSCSSLQKLQIETSAIKKFIPAFSQQIKDPKFLPNLADISIRSSWPASIDMNRTVFVEQGQADRAGLKIGITDRLYYPSSSDSSSSSETSHSSSSTSSSG